MKNINTIKVNFKGGIISPAELYNILLAAAKSGLFTKIVLPYLVKNYSSHIFSEEKRRKIVSKIKDLFDKIRPKRPGTDASAFADETA